MTSLLAYQIGPPSPHHFWHFFVTFLPPPLLWWSLFYNCRSLFGWLPPVPITFVGHFFANPFSDKKFWQFPTSHFWQFVTWNFCQRKPVICNKFEHDPMCAGQHGMTSHFWQFVTWNFRQREPVKYTQTLILLYKATNSNTTQCVLVNMAWLPISGNL